MYPWKVVKVSNIVNDINKKPLPISVFTKYIGNILGLNKQDKTIVDIKKNLFTLPLLYLYLYLTLPLPLFSLQRVPIIFKNNLKKRQW